MPDQSIICPGCGKKFPLTDVLRQQISEQVRTEMEREFSQKQKIFEAEQSKARKEIERRQRELKTAEEALEAQVQERLEARLPGLQAKARKDAEAKIAVDLQDREEQVKELSGKVATFQKSELEFRKRSRELDEKEKAMELEMARMLEGERKVVEEKVRTEESERWEDKLRVKDEELTRVKKALDHAQRVGASGELMGEVAERTLEERLREAFDEDGIEPIGRGKAGADVLHSVAGGGSILWESKDRYPSWSKDWVPKLIRDRDEAKASIGILVSTIGPDGKPLRAPQFNDGVVLAPPWAAVGVASLLRPQLAEMARQRRLYDKQETLQAAVYAWVTSQEFQRGIGAIVDNLRRLERQVSRAKVNHAKWFKHLEVEVDRTMRSVGEFYGSARGHAKLPDLRALALNPGTPADGEVAEDEESVGEDHVDGEAPGK